MKLNRTRGFTLFELLVTLTLVSLLLATVAPAISNSVISSQQSQVVDTIQSTLHRARQQAIIRHRSISFLINTEERFFQLAGESGQQKIPDDLRVRVLTAKSLIDDDGARIQFHADGSSSGGALWIVAGDTAYIEVDWLTGRISRPDDIPDVVPFGEQSR